MQPDHHPGLFGAGSLTNFRYAASELRPSWAKSAVSLASVLCFRRHKDRRRHKDAAASQPSPPDGPPSSGPFTPKPSGAKPLRCHRDLSVARAVCARHRRGVVSGDPDRISAALSGCKGACSDAAAAADFSILKPLSGCDDGLLANLESFAALDHPDYEVLLGVHTIDDPAVSVARLLVDKHPQRFLVVQDGSPGLNPKVNQLITLAKEARHDVLLVSDASVRVGNGYLPEIAACLEDPDIGLVTHIFAAEGEQSWARLLDNFHLMSHYGGGAIAARDAGGQTLVNGKSTAFRRADLDAMGGFAAVCDYAAEDFVLGLWVGRKIKKKVCFARYTPIHYRSIGRWGIHSALSALVDHAAHRRRLSGVSVADDGLSVDFGVAGLAVSTVAAWSFLVARNRLLSKRVRLLQASMLRYKRISPLLMLLRPINDLMVAWIWTYGLLWNRTVWRNPAQSDVGNQARAAFVNPSTARLFCPVLLVGKHPFPQRIAKQRKHQERTDEPHDRIGNRRKPHHDAKAAGVEQKRPHLDEYKAKSCGPIARCPAENNTRWRLPTN